MFRNNVVVFILTFNHCYNNKIIVPCLAAPYFILHRNYYQVRCEALQGITRTLGLNSGTRQRAPTIDYRELAPKKRRYRKSKRQPRAESRHPSQLVDGHDGAGILASPPVPLLDVDFAYQGHILI